jgi:hypothetical protein
MVPVQGELVFIPYWRMRGTRMALSETACRAEIIDHSALAVPFKEFPETLGIRSQTMTLKFVGPESTGIFFPPVLEKDDFVKRMENNPLPMRELTKRNIDPVAKNVALMGLLGTPGLEAFTAGLEKESLVRAYIGEIVSVVYAPYFINGQTVIDGITGRPVFKAQSAGALCARQESAPLKLSFVPILCPQCDWNLQGEKETLVLACRHCGTAWQASECGLRPVETRIMTGGSDTALWVPFWILDVDYGALKLSSFADFIRLTNFPIPLKPESEGGKFSMWVPAFKANPEIYFRLGKRMSILQADTHQPETLPENIYPVTLPPSEAFQSLPIVLGEIAVAKKKVFPLVKNTAFSLRGATLALVPFDERGAEFVQRQSEIAISKNALLWGKGI